jgi:hypothetical protein
MQNVTQKLFLMQNFKNQETDTRSLAIELEVKRFLGAIKQYFEISDEQWTDAFATIKALVPYEQSNKSRRNSLLSVLRLW